MFPEFWKASSPAASVPNPLTCANITTTNSTPVRISVPANALGMLRPGSSVSSPIEAQASNPAHDRKAATTALSTAEADTPSNENALKSIPVVGAPPLAKITTTSTIMDRMPMPSMASRIFASSRTSRPDSRNETAAPTTTTASHGS